MLLQKLRDEKIEPLNDTLKDYDQLWQRKKNDLTHRLRSLYSYDIKDNADFKRTQKTEKFIRERMSKK